MTDYIPLLLTEFADVLTPHGVAVTYDQLRHGRWKITCTTERVAFTLTTRRQGRKGWVYDSDHLIVDDTLRHYVTGDSIAEVAHHLVGIFQDPDRWAPSPAASRDEQLAATHRRVPVNTIDLGPVVAVDDDAPVAVQLLTYAIRQKKLGDYPITATVHRREADWQVCTPLPEQTGYTALIAVFTDGQIDTGFYLVDTDGRTFHAGANLESALSFAGVDTNAPPANLGPIGHAAAKPRGKNDTLAERRNTVIRN